MPIHRRIFSLLAGLPIAMAMLALGVLPMRGEAPEGAIFDLTMAASTGDSVSLRELRDARATVFIFLEESCPICQGYSLTMRALHERFAPAGIRFYGVFPNGFSSPDSVTSFQRSYGLPFTMLMDEDRRLTPLLHARITPEAVVVSPAGAILYRGRIDNLFYALGRRRGVITEHDLQDVLQAVADGRPAKSRTTQAIGCFIASEPSAAAGDTTDR